MVSEQTQEKQIWKVTTRSTSGKKLKFSLNRDYTIMEPQTTSLKWMCGETTISHM